MTDTSYKQRATDATDNILLGVVNSDCDDFQEYEKETLDWSWDNISED